MTRRILNISPKYTVQHQKLLENNPIGTPGISMIYQHRRVIDKLKHIPKPWFVNLQRRNQLIGTCCFCERNETSVTNYYIRYFAFEQSKRVKRNSGAFNLKNGIIKSEVQDILDHKSFDSENSHYVFYAYLDPSNERSKVICEGFGFETVRNFKSILMSRFKPKKRIQFEKPTFEERKYLVNELKNFYTDFNFYNDENLFFDDSYFICKEGDEIVAGIQAVEEKWWIHKLPGLSGKILLSVGSKLPWINKLIQKDFQFLALEAAYCKVGFEYRLEQLIESVMACKDSNVAMIVLDTKSHLVNMFDSFDKGFISNLSNPKENEVIAKTNTSIDHYKNKPAYISTIDLT